MTSILWSASDGSSFERCTLHAIPEGYRISGTSLLLLDTVPYEIRYSVIADEQWHTRTVGAHVEGPERDRRLALSADGTGNWFVSDSPLLELFGAMDIDLSWTPATNTLAIRRLDLAVGESAETTAAWIAFPQHEIERRTQRYERLDETTYLYSTDGQTADLVVNEHGMVRDHGGRWIARAETGA